MYETVFEITVIFKAFDSECFKVSIRCLSTVEKTVIEHFELLM